MDGARLIVQRLFQHQDSALGVQVEERAAVLVPPAVDGEHQLAVGVRVLGADLQDVLPGRRVLRNPHLGRTRAHLFPPPAHSWRQMLPRRPAHLVQPLGEDGTVLVHVQHADVGLWRTTGLRRRKCGRPQLSGTRGYIPPQGCHGINVETLMVGGAGEAPLPAGGPRLF